MMSTRKETPIPEDHEDKREKTTGTTPDNTAKRTEKEENDAPEGSDTVEISETKETENFQETQRVEQKSPQKNTPPTQEIKEPEVKTGEEKDETDSTAMLELSPEVKQTDVPITQESTGELEKRPTKPSEKVTEFDPKGNEKDQTIDGVQSNYYSFLTFSFSGQTSPKEIDISEHKTAKNPEEGKIVFI